MSTERARQPHPGDAPVAAHPSDEAEPQDLQARLERTGEDARPYPDAGGPDPTIDDPVGLIHRLEAARRFHRDSGFGRIFHPSSVSFRENLPTDSLHIVVNGNHISAHVDRVSPLGIRAERPSRYSLQRAVAHNLAGAAQSLLLLLRGRQGDHRSEIDCEWVWDPAHSEPKEGDLLNPRASTWSVQLETRVAHELDGPRLQQALAVALGRRPIDRELLDVLSCRDDEALDAARAEFQATPVGLSSWPPLRARLAKHAGGDVLMLNFNHAAADGPSALQVLRSVAEAYAGHSQPRPRPEFLAVSTLPVRPASAPVSVLKARCRHLVEALRDRLARPARLATDHATDEAGFGFHFLRLSDDDTRRIVDATRPGTSRNVLLAALHLAIGDWNLQHGTPGRRVGVLVPVNLRPPDWSDELIANFSVTARVSTSRRHRAGPAIALKTITAQTTRNKRTRTGIALVAALERNALLPLWAKQSLVVLQPLTRNRFLDTAMLANLGRIEEVPAFGPEAGDTSEMWFSSPARTPESLCVGALTMGGRLHLTFRYPHRLFGPESVRRFASCYIDHLRTVAAGNR